MTTRLRQVMLLAQTVVLSLTPCFGKNSSEIVKQRERNTISLELEITKKNSNALQRFMSFLNLGPNGYATGFMVGDHLVRRSPGATRLRRRLGGSWHGKNLPRRKTHR